MKKLSYMDSVHRDGTIWNLSVMVLLLLFPISLIFIFGAMPDWGALVMGLIATAPMYWAVGVIETITFVPMLGAGGSYLSFVTGNISNLKLPCALNALEQNGVSGTMRITPRMMITVVTILETAMAMVDTTSPSSLLALTPFCSSALMAQGSFKLEILPVTKLR